MKEDSAVSDNETICKRLKLESAAVVAVPPGAIDICQQLRTTSLCLNRILGDPALGGHIRGYYVGVVMEDVLHRLVEIRNKLEWRRNEEALVNELAGYMEYYADSPDFMAGAMTTMRTFCQGIERRVRNDINLRVLPYILQATCKHDRELGVPFVRLVWDTLSSPFMSEDPRYTPFMEALVKGGVMHVLVQMACNMKSYLEYSTSGYDQKVDAYYAVKETILELSYYLNEEQSSYILAAAWSYPLRVAIPRLLAEIDAFEHVSDEDDSDEENDN